MKKQSILLIILLFCSYSAIAQTAENLAETRSLEVLPGLMEDVKSLEKESNEERLEVIRRMLDSRGTAYDIETFTLEREGRLSGYPRGVGSNIIVNIGSGENDIVVCGHWDAAWLQDGTLSRAVIDNGVAVVVLVRLAEVLQKMELNNRIRLVFFDMEEVGLIGSREFVKVHKEENIVAAVNLDVIGYGTTIMFGPSSTAGPNPLYRAAKEACVDFGIRFIDFPQYPNSDDRNFQKAGIDNISIGTGPVKDLYHMWLMLNGGSEVLNPEIRPGIIQYIHSELDNSDNVTPESINIAYTVVLDMVKRLDIHYR